MTMMPARFDKTAPDGKIERALFLLRTPFQIKMAMEICELESIDTVDCIFISRNDDPRNRFYFDKIARKSRNACFFHYDIDKPFLMGYAKAALQFPAWLLRHRYDAVFVSSFNTWYYSAVVSWHRRSRICTFDDGTGSLLNSGASIRALESGRDRVLSKIFGMPLQRMIDRVDTNYTIDERFEPIASHAKKRQIPLKHHDLPPADKGEVTIFVGQNFHEYLDQEQIERLADFINRKTYDYAVHPRESNQYCEGIFEPQNVIRTNLLLEDYVAELRREGFRITLYGAVTTALITLRVDGVEKVYLAAKANEAWENFMTAFGCRIHRL